MFKEYVNYDATQLALMIKTKQISAKELLEAVIARANKLNPKLNAIIHRFDDKAFQAINDLPQGVFAGVPFLVKDLTDAVAGEPFTMGSRGINLVPDYDSELIKRYKSTGVNLFGKTNTPEFGLIITTEPQAHGATHNPHKKGYSAGGSSGGSACAVASGIVPMASAGDGGGSIRFPASWCGIYGLKPSRGRNPLGPDYGEGWSGAVANHVLTRSVRDCAAMLDATHGHEAASPYNIAPPTGSFLDASLRAPKQLKIAVMQDSPVPNTPLDPCVKKTLENTAKQLEHMGHIVDYAEPAIDKDRYWVDFSVVVCAHVAQLEDEFKRTLGKEAVAKFETRTKNTAMLGRSFSAMQFVEAKNGWHLVQKAMGELFANYDVVLCPTVPTPAVKHGKLLPNSMDNLLMKGLNMTHINMGNALLDAGLLEQKNHPVMSKMAFTMLGNMTGLPCASVPLGMSKQGLPIGMQFIGKMGDEETLLSLSGEFERAGLFTGLAL